MLEIKASLDPFFLFLTLFLLLIGYGILGGSYSFLLGGVSCHRSLSFVRLMHTQRIVSLCNLCLCWFQRLSMGEVASTFFEPPMGFSGWLSPHSVGWSVSPRPLLVVRRGSAHAGRFSSLCFWTWYFSQMLPTWVGGHSGGLVGFRSVVLQILYCQSIWGSSMLSTSGFMHFRRSICLKSCKDHRQSASRPLLLNR